MPTSYPYFYSPFDYRAIDKLCSFFRDKSDLFFEGFVKFNLYVYGYPMSEHNLPFLPPSTITLPIFIPPMNDNTQLFYDIRGFYNGLFYKFYEYIFGNVVRINPAENFVFASGSTYYNSYGGLTSGRDFNIELPQHSYFEGSYYAIVLCNLWITDVPSQVAKPLWSLVSPADYERVIDAFDSCKPDLELIYPSCRQVGSGWSKKFNFLPDRTLINAHRNPQIHPRGNLLLMYTYIPRLAIYSKDSSSIINLQLPDPVITEQGGTIKPKIIEYTKIFMDVLYSEGLVSYNYENYGSAWRIYYVGFESHASIWGYKKPISNDNPVHIDLPIFEPAPSGGGGDGGDDGGDDGGYGDY